MASISDELRVSNFKLFVMLNGDKIKATSVKANLILKEHEYLKSDKPKVSLILKDKTSEIKISDVRISFFTKKVQRTQKINFRTLRRVRGRGNVSENYNSRRELHKYGYVDCLHFNGKSSYGYSNNPSSGSKEFTMVLEFNTDSALADWLVGWESNVNGGLGISIENGKAVVLSTMGGEITGESWTGNKFNAGVTVNDGRKHTIAIRSDGSKISIFIDKVKVDTELPITKDVDDFKLYFGRKEDGIQYSKFDLRKFTMYNRGLSDTELKKLPDDAIERFDKFYDESLIRDTSNNGNHLTLRNVTLDSVKQCEDISSDFDTQRRIRGHIEVSYDFEANRQKVYSFDATYNARRSIENSKYIVTHNNHETRRTLRSIPSNTYGYAVSREIDLGDVYDVIPTLNIKGSTTAEIKTATDYGQYNPWQEFRPTRVTCRYIKIRLKVNGYCKGATLTLTIPPQEETITAQVDGVTTIHFRKLYAKTPAIFPAYSGNNLVIQNVTPSSCTLYITDNKNNKIKGEVTLLIRG